MNRHKWLGIGLLSLAAILTVPALIATAAAKTDARDPYREARVSKQEAAQRCRTMADSMPAPATSGTTPGSKPVASIPDGIDGALESFYDIQFGDASCQVDVNDGRVIALALLANLPVSSDVRVAPAAAQQIAEEFFASHGIPTEGLVASVQLVDHGQSADYEVEWSGTANGALVPDNRWVSVNPATGYVAAFSDHRHPYSIPPAPSVTRATAESAALRAMGAAAGPTTQDATFAVSRSAAARLEIRFALNGRQLLVWNVTVTENVTSPSGSSSGTRVQRHVEVDASTGSTVVVPMG